MTSKVIVLEDNFAAARNAITGSILMEAAKAGGHVIEGHAKVNASSGRPGLEVQTGNLMNAINVTEGSKSETYAEVNIGPGSVVYAAIHEFGGVIVTENATIHIPARPYMRPAIDENSDSIEGAVEAKIKHSLDRVT
jgi:phage gpG-like protein